MPIGGEVPLQQRAAARQGFLRWGWPRGPGHGAGYRRATRAAAPRRCGAGRAALPALRRLSLGATLRLGRRLAVRPARLAVSAGFAFIRIPERLALLAMAFLALLAGRGIDVVARGGYRSLAVLLAALVPLEHLSLLPQHERVPVGRGRPAVYEWIAAHGARALAEVPIHGEALVRKETLEQYFSTAHFFGR